MSYRRCLFALGIWAVLVAVAAAAPMKALIVDGQNDHDWKETTPVLKKLLEETGPVHGRRGHLAAEGPGHERLQARLRRLRRGGEQLHGRRLAGGDQKAFVDYVAGGGGLVIYHFGLQRVSQVEGVQRDDRPGRLGRPQREGRALRPLARRQDRPRHDARAAAAGTARSTPFQLIVREPDHPITKGLPEKFMHSADELYGWLRGPAKNLTVLATAFAAQGARAAPASTSRC